MKRVIREYSLEISAVMAAALGVFLLVERVQIRQNLIALLEKLLESMGAIGSSIKTGLTFFLSNISLSDLIGWNVLFLAIMFFVWRVRYRFLNSEHLRAADCPKCGGALVIIHRTWLDRIISKIFLPHAHRFRCRSLECNWSGLRRSHFHASLIIHGEEHSRVGPLQD